MKTKKNKAELENRRGWEYYYQFSLLLTAIIAILYGVFWAPQSVDYKGIIQKNVLGVISIEKMMGNQHAYKIDTAQGRFYAVCDSAIGYQSKVEAMTIVNEKGLIEKVIITKQGETPVFFERLTDQKYFDGFQGLAIKEPIYLGGAYGYSGYLGSIKTNNYIDRVTGSTVSSHAVAEAVNKGNSYLSGQFFNTQWANPYDLFQLSWKDMAMIAMFLIAFASAFIKKLVKIRLAFLLVSVVVLGFLVNQFVTGSLLLSAITLQIPRITNLKWYVLMAGSLGFIILLGKNLYCAWICPFGAVQEILNKAAGFKSLNISQKTIKILRLVAPTILWVALLLGTLLGDYGTLDYQPFGALFLFKSVWLMWLMLPIFLFMSLFISRFYCKFFCPVGFIYNLLNRWRNEEVRIWKQRVDRLKRKKKEKQETLSSHS
ncbi:4Fe-4S binding protein [Dehalobacter restrictus]|uniref:4Fe-4S binding protein n=1 Tax=Dehalobacter restrictus TaxID=55583 RepID=UPI00338FD599